MEVNGIETTEEIRYDSLNLSPEIMGVLEQKGFQTATPVQGGCIPFLMEYKDVVAKAPTGTGKTFAFGIPVVEHTDPAGTDVTALILGAHPGVGHPDSGRPAGAGEPEEGDPGGLPLRRPAH